MSKTHSGIIVAGGISPRSGRSSSDSVLRRLEFALHCDQQKWYVIAYDYQPKDPSYVTFLSEEILDVLYVRYDQFSPSGESGIVLSVLPPELVTDDDWSIIKQFRTNHSSKDLPLLIAQRFEGSAMGSSPIWRDANFIRKGTYVVGQFMFHALHVIDSG